MTTLTIGTRGSALAIAQTNSVVAVLRAAHPTLGVQIKVISTKGDRVLDVALSKIGDKGLFVSELEAALLQGEIDLAVHSAKDLPSQLPEGLALTAFLARGNVHDVIVTRVKLEAASGVSTLDQALPAGSHVGTSSLRRICQLRALRPDLRIGDVRGNVDTRLRKLADGQFDALVLAAAGLERLSFIDHAADDQPIELKIVSSPKLVAVLLPVTVMLPAVAQGALAIESRQDDDRTKALLVALNHADTQMAVLAERAVLRRLEGGCQVPIAAYAQITGNHMHLTGLVGSIDGMRLIRSVCEGDVVDAENLGTALAEHLLSAGAADVLRKARSPGHAQPLGGVRVVITRAEDRSERLAARLRELGAEPIMYPVIAYAPPDNTVAFADALRRLVDGAYDWLVLTSAMAVEAISAWARANTQDMPPLQIAAVGPATAEACVAKLHRQPAVVPDRFAGDALADALGDLAHQHVLLLNADIAMPALQYKLEALGADVERVIAYRTIAAEPNDVDLNMLLAENTLHAILFTSGSTVRQFVERLTPAALDAVRNHIIVCIGPSTAQVAQEVNLPVSAVALAATEDGMIESLINVVASRSKI